MNVVFAFSDQHRLQSTGFGGDSVVKTPVMDRMAREACNFTMAISGQPVCCAYRASLMSGQYPQTHGVILNDAPFDTQATCLADAFRLAGYDTAYIGKWHINGHGRSAYIPPERRRGFAYWKTLECTHDYNASDYFSGDERTLSRWDGYDAFSQTDDALDYLKKRERTRPVFLMLSWGPPHNPYGTAPEAYRRRYPADEGALRPNVPFEMRALAARDVAGYNAHVAAIDDCLGRLLQGLEALDMTKDTIVVYTSDHGDMLYSQGVQGKQKPWDESIRVPFVLKDPRATARTLSTPLNSPDIMPTLLDLCGLAVPESVEGQSHAQAVLNGAERNIEAALIQCIHPCGGWHKFAGGREYRGVRTARYTFVRDLNGPWLLYDNQEDPYQMDNLLDWDRSPRIMKSLEETLRALLTARDDAFLPGRAYLKKWGYQVDFIGTMPY